MEFACLRWGSQGTDLEYPWPLCSVKADGAAEVAVGSGVDR